MIHSINKKKNISHFVKKLYFIKQQQLNHDGSVFLDRKKNNFVEKEHFFVITKVQIGLNPCLDYGYFVITTNNDKIIQS